MDEETERPPFDLTESEAVAVEAAKHWGIELRPRFSLSNVSYVAPAGDAVVKVAWGGDDESEHEADALSLWNGVGAVRLLGRFGRAILEERAVPGDDLAALSEREATAIAIDVASKLWQRARPPFRPVMPEVRRWLDEAAGEDSELTSFARDLLPRLGEPAGWIVHGDFHHHNILRHGERYVAIDPKPYAAEREYDVPAFLWNPMENQLDDRSQLEARIAAFVAAGLDEFRIRAWTVIRGAYLRPEYAAPIGALL